MKTTVAFSILAVSFALCAGCAGPEELRPAAHTPGHVAPALPDNLCGDAPCESEARVQSSEGSLQNSHVSCDAVLASVRVGFLDGRSFFQEGTVALGQATEQD